jgi:osmotically-inducible protein OsmY
MVPDILLNTECFKDKRDTPAIYGRRRTKVMIIDKLWNSRNGHLSDADIAVKIKEVLRSYGPLRATKSSIQVDVSGGVATLRGAVRGAGQRDMAGQLAATVDGVETVHNQIQDDSKIEGAVARDLATHPLLRLSTTRIKIKSFNGIVTLYGPVLNQVQQMTAETVTRRVPGVEGVVNRLVVIPSENGHFR